MSIKHLFDDLKCFGKKKYFQKNAEEELYFFNKSITINIYRIGNCIGINLNTNGKNENFMDSNILSIDEKNSINFYLKAYAFNPSYCKEVSKILLQALKKHI